MFSGCGMLGSGWVVVGSCEYLLDMRGSVVHGSGLSLGSGV